MVLKKTETHEVIRAKRIEIVDSKDNTKGAFFYDEEDNSTSIVWSISIL